MVSKNRWTEAQEYERGYWERKARNIEKRQERDLSWYRWRADRLRSLLERTAGEAACALQDARVLEVGSGPVGIVSYLDVQSAAAIDPLADYYATKPNLVEHRNPKVEFHAGGGEDLPFATAEFDLLIIDNVIDHVQDAHAVMGEAHRVLKPGATLYFTVNLHPFFGAVLHQLASKFRIDRGHPHTFTLGRARRFLRDHGFAVLHDEHEDYWESTRRDLRSTARKDRLKAISGLSEFLYTSVGMRN